MKSLVLSVALYGCEGWTLGAGDERRVGAFELWTWRRMLRVSWMEHKTNEWVRGRVGVREDDGLLNVIKRKKMEKILPLEEKTWQCDVSLD